MTKLKQLKEAMRNPPPERLAKIEYKSHFMQMLGVSIVSVILIVKGFWYIIFAFIFSLGISYSGGMTAYKKYQNIMALLGKENPLEFEKDISPSRRRSKIVNHVIGPSAKWASVICSVIIAIMIIPPTINRFLLILAYFLTIMISYILLYFFFFYWVAYPFYKKEMKIK